MRAAVGSRSDVSLPRLRPRLHGMSDQVLAQRPRGTWHLVSPGDHSIECRFDVVAVRFGERQSGQQLHRVTPVSGDLRENMVLFEKRYGDKLTEQALVGRLDHAP